LIERHARGDEQREAGPLAPAAAPEALPERGDAARVAGADDRVEAADVDAELERVGRDHATNAAAAQPALDAAAGVGEVAAAVGLDELRIDLVGLEPIAEVL